MVEKKNPITVYSESTPNPNTMKFVANILLVKNIPSVEFTSPDKAKPSPLAMRLFTFPFVESVFFSSNFVTITKSAQVDWMDITAELRQYITDYLTLGYPVLEDDLIENMASKEKLNNINNHVNQVNVTPKTQTEEQIVQLLDEYIRPAVASDGGAIDFKSYENGKLTVTLKGSCSGCPASTITLKNGIENLFKQMMPEVTEVVAENQ